MPPTTTPFSLPTHSQMPPRCRAPGCTVVHSVSSGVAFIGRSGVSFAVNIVHKDELEAGGYIRDRVVMAEWSKYVGGAAKKDRKKRAEVVEAAAAAGAPPLAAHAGMHACHHPPADVKRTKRESGSAATFMGAQLKYDEHPAQLTADKAAYWHCRGDGTVFWPHKYQCDRHLLAATMLLTAAEAREVMKLQHAEERAAAAAAGAGAGAGRR
jgi:hypothetical protein